MNNMINFAMTLLSRNPQIANNPTAKNMIEVIQSNDSKRGQEIAENLCSTYGVKKEDAEEGARYGYNPNRYSSGRYAPTGRGTRGYRPYEDLDMIDAWAKDLDDNGMRYRMGFNAGGRSGVKMSDAIRSGGSHMVDPDMYSEHSSNWDSRYGDAYNKYRTSRKHYTESKSAADKLEMDEHANEHINDTIATMKEIYKSADPDMRKRMKENVQKLVSEMIV